MLTLKPIASVLNSAGLMARIPPEIVALADSVAPWTSYAAFAPDGTAAGVCAFKSAPSEKSEVEIAYLTFAEHERRGYGTAMASLLVSMAAASGKVRKVTAHTLRDENASVRICRRLGFVLEGEFQDPDDGLVWRWSKSVG